MIGQGDTMKRVSWIGSLVITTVAVATVLAQAPPPKPGGGSTSSSTSTTSTDTTGTAKGTDVQQSLQEILEESNAPDSYHYDPQGRRDPFQSLIGPAPRLQAGSRPPGVPGFLIDELKLQGVVRTKQGFVAMMNGPDNKGYLIRVSDKVLDGEVIRVTEGSVVFRQEVNDPTRIERYREVVKELSSEAQKR